jgi:hypothetical protein
MKQRLSPGVALIRNALRCALHYIALSTVTLLSCHTCLSKEGIKHGMSRWKDQTRASICACICQNSSAGPRSPRKGAFKRVAWWIKQVVACSLVAMTNDAPDMSRCAPALQSASMYAHPDFGHPGLSGRGAPFRRHVHGRRIPHNSCTIILNSVVCLSSPKDTVDMGKKSGGKAPNDPTNFSDSSLQVLHVLHEVGDHTPSAILSVGDDRLVFNCGEGFQRCSSEGQVWKLPAIVTTSPCNVRNETSPTQ